MDRLLAAHARPTVTATTLRRLLAGLLYLAALLSPLWFLLAWLGSPSATDGFMRNVDSVSVAVIDTRSGREWTVQPGATIAMDRGHYRVGDLATPLEFDPSDTVLASALTWDIARSGVRAQHIRDVFEGMLAWFVITVVALLAAAMILSLPPGRPNQRAAAFSGRGIRPS